MFSDDTTPKARAVLLDGFRRMSPARKMRRVLDLNRTLDRLARARILAQYGPDLSEREIRLRLAALRLPRHTMIEVFGWNPEVEGR